MHTISNENNFASAFEASFGKLNSYLEKKNLKKDQELETILSEFKAIKAMFIAKQTEAVTPEMMFEAIKKNDMEALVRYTPAFTDISQLRLKGDSLLHFALTYNASIEMLQHLISSGPAMVQIRDSEGKLPLHIACQYCFSSEVALIADAFPGALKEQDIHGFTPLHTAVYSCSSFETIELVSQRCPVAAQMRDVHGRLAIHLATLRDSCPEVVLLLVRLYPESSDKADASGNTFDVEINNKVSFVDEEMDDSE